MATLKSIKKRITTVKNTQKITKAMKMVAAAKLRRAQEAVTGARPYAKALSGVIEDIVSKTPPEKSGPLFQVRDEVRHVEMLVFSSNRGLCGSFNSNLLRRTFVFLNELKAKGISYRVNVVGKKARDFFRARKVQIENVNIDWADKVTFEDALAHTQKVFGDFVEGKFDQYFIVYNKFESALKQIPTFDQLLPISVSSRRGEATSSSGVDFIYEPEREEILHDLLPKYGAVQFLRAHLESLASELGSRMSAMDSATGNASDMIGKLTLLYNRLRQAAITTELMDIVNGAESIK